MEYDRVLFTRRRELTLGSSLPAMNMSVEAFDENKPMTHDAALTSTTEPARFAAAERMRRHRERRRDGLRCLTIELRETEIDTLVRMGLLKREMRHREDLLLVELVAVAGDDGMSDREGQKLEHELLVHFGGDVEAALEAFAAGDASLANGKLLIEGQKPQTVSDAIQALVADGILAPTGTCRPGRDGKLEPVYALTDKGLAEQPARAMPRRMVH